MIWPASGVGVSASPTVRTDGAPKASKRTVRIRLPEVVGVFVIGFLSG
ncbi:hypothetical protein RKD42_003668 [Streptomyces ambofaciens]